MSGPAVRWELIGDASKSNKAVDEATTKVGGITGKLQGVGKGMVLGAGMAAFNLLSGAIDGVVGKLGEAHQAFLDDQVSQVNLANSLKNNIPNWDGNAKGAEDYASAQAHLGFQDDDIRKSLGQLVGVTHDLGEAQKLNALALDISRAKGIDLAAATDIVTKAAQGQGKALRGLGIDIHGAKTAAELLQAAQDNVAGSAEKWAQTSEGKTAVSQVKVAEAMEKVGGIVDKVAQVALPILADAFSNVVDIIGNVVEAAQPLISEIAKRLEPVIKAVGPIAEKVFAAIGTAVRALAPVVSNVFGVIGTVIDTAIKVWNVAFTAVSGAIGALGKVFSTFADLVGKVFGAIGGIVKAPINFVIGLINSVIDAINGIQVHIHVGPVDIDWNGLNIGHIPKLHSGGVVPGVPGEDVLTMLQAGEEVRSRSDVMSGNGTEIHIHIDQGAYIDGPSIDALARLISQRLRISGA